MQTDLRSFTSLRELTICNFEGLESWVSGLQFPLSLERLAIEGFPNLEILPSLDNLNSLLKLGIINWRKLKYLPTGLQQLSWLEGLRIGGFWEEFDSFPDFQVGSLMHLTSLSLYGWPKLKSLPQQIQHLTSLTLLRIELSTNVYWKNQISWCARPQDYLYSSFMLKQLQMAQTFALKSSHWRLYFFWPVVAFFRMLDGCKLSKGIDAQDINFLAQPSFLMTLLFRNTFSS
ncbi:hypothetical protein C1H46_044849 [Malus baccata]|uniref:Uncharacterized protein n=1 Tax=Malus baccata TaxID=106549 RepID=A0A540K5W9_MALBA|nr:hypothetical protein C1H46_044849 [Malus baccata]